MTAMAMALMSFEVMKVGGMGVAGDGHGGWMSKTAVCDHGGVERA